MRSTRGQWTSACGRSPPRTWRRSSTPRALPVRPGAACSTHANFLSATAMYRGQLELDDVQPVIYMFLPLAHVLGTSGADGDARCRWNDRLLVRGLRQDRRRAARCRADALRRGASDLREDAHLGDECRGGLRPARPDAVRVGARGGTQGTHGRARGQAAGPTRARTVGSGRPSGAREGTGTVRRAPGDGAGRRGADRPPSCWRSSTPAA